MNFDVIMDWLIWTFCIGWDLAYRIAREGIMISIILLSMCLVWLVYILVGMIAAPKEFRPIGK